MAKPDPALLNPARYPFHCAISTRFGDLDINMHVNNVALVGIMEEGRVRFNLASGFGGAVAGQGSLTSHRAETNASGMIASFAVEFLGQAFYPQPLDVYAAAASVGRTSFSVLQLATQEGRIVCSSRTVLVCVADNRSAALPADFGESIGPWLLRI
jgi:acyl-CoA thioester hydrolase